MSGKRETYILAVDLGTSAAKVALVSTGGTVAAYASGRDACTFSYEWRRRTTTGQLVHAIKAATHRVLAQNIVPPEDIIALCCTTQWSGTVAVDRDGQSIDERHHLDGLPRRALRRAHHRRASSKSRATRSAS